MVTYADEWNMQIRSLLMLSYGGQITGKGRGERSLTPPPPCYPLWCFLNAILPAQHSLFSPRFFSDAHYPVTGFQLQLLLVSLLSDKSTSLEPSHQNLLQQGGWLKLSGMTCGLDGAGSGGGVNTGRVCETFE